MPPSSVCEVTSAEVQVKVAGPPPARGSFSQELANHLGPDARPDCSPLGAGSDWQHLIFRSWELRPGHDLIQACVLLLCQHHLCWYYQLCPIWPTSIHLRTHNTCTNTHARTQFRKDLVSCLNRLAALIASSFSVFHSLYDMIQGKKLFLKGVRRDAFENAFLRENGDVLF